MIKKLKERKDIAVLLLIMLVYTIVSFINLGSLTNPQTFWEAKTSRESVVIKLDKPTKLSYALIYSGCKFGNYTIAFSADNINYSSLIAVKCDKVFAWKKQDLIKENLYQYIKIESQNPNIYLGEIGIYDSNENLIKAEGTNKKSSLLVDEQNTVPEYVSYMNTTYFDEIYFTRTAYEHLHNMDAYEWTHPPLGKLIMSIPISIMGMTPFAYRLFGNLAGILMIPAMFILGKLLFKRSRYGLLAAALIALDGMHFVQTRIGTVDSYLVLFILLEFVFMYKYILSVDKPLRKRLLYLFLSGICMSVTLAIKWSSAFSALGLAVVFFVSLIMEVVKKKKWTKQHTIIILCCIVFFIIIPITIYVLSFIPFFINGKIKDFNGFINWQKSMFNYHNDLKATHPYTSKWYTWPMTTNSLLFWTGSTPDNLITRIALLGNPLIFWVSIPCMLFVLIRNRKFEYWFLIIVILCSYLPFAAIKRIMFLYHYFPVLPFAILCIVAFMKWFCEKIHSNIPMYILVVGALIVFGLFYPIYSGLPITYEYSNSLKWLSTWIW